MSAVDPDPQSSPALDPQTWIDLLTVHSLKNDFFSARTLMIIHEGIERMAKVRAQPGSILVPTPTQANLYERLYKAFNNPHLLKEAGVILLQQWHLPDSALKHFDLARQFAPADRDIEELQVAAALAIARDVTNRAGHSGIDEPVPAKPEVDAVLRKTTKLAHVTEAREDPSTSRPTSSVACRRTCTRRRRSTTNPPRPIISPRSRAAQGFPHPRRFCRHGRGAGRSGAARRAQGGFAGQLRAGRRLPPTTRASGMRRSRLSSACAISTRRRSRAGSIADSSSRKWGGSTTRSRPTRRR